MNQATIRAWCFHRQGLDGAVELKSAAGVLEQSGWARSVGGAGPYLTLFSRAGIGRRDADVAVATQQIHELPSARGCTYVIPASQFALALRVSQNFGNAEMKTAVKLGVTGKEVDKLCNAVVRALANGPLEPDEIRTATGNASRNLGPEGVKKGMTTTLPLALGILQSNGDIRRIPMNGRLDQQRYKYTLWRPNPLAKFKLTADEAYTELARLFFRWIGPAALAEFQWFSGLGVKAAKAAIEPLKLVPINAGDTRVMFADDLDNLQAFQVPRQPHYALVSSLDAISALRRDVIGLVDPQDLDRKVLAERSTQPISAFSDLPSHAILDRGRLIGFWEYDTAGESIAWTSFVPKDAALEAAVKRTEQYVRDQLGDARSFSLDSPKSRAPKIEALKRAAGRN